MSGASGSLVYVKIPLAHEKLEGVCALLQGDLVVAEMREGYAAARQAVRRACGIRMLLGLLHARSSMPAGQVDRLRALATRCLLGLAHDPQLRHILAKLQVRARVGLLQVCRLLLNNTGLAVQAHAPCEPSAGVEGGVA